MLFRTQIIFCSSELRLHFRIAEVGSLLSLNRAWRAQVTCSNILWSLTKQSRGASTLARNSLSVDYRKQNGIVSK